MGFSFILEGLHALRNGIYAAGLDENTIFLKLSN